MKKTTQPKQQKLAGINQVSKDIADYLNSAEAREIDGFDPKINGQVNRKTKAKFMPAEGSIAAAAVKDAINIAKHG